MTIKAWLSNENAKGVCVGVAHKVLTFDDEE
jgi:hypothetical protein